MIIDLNSRTTSDWNRYCEYVKSRDSLIYIDKKNVKGEGVGCLDFTVGNRWYNPADKQWYAIPEHGLTLKANESITIETQEQLGIPLNVFGVVTGVGRNIYTGGIVSTGKIDPGFNSKLRIGFFNSSKRKKTIKSGDVLCSCYFIQTETSAETPLEKYFDEEQKLPSMRGYKFRKFVISNWSKIIPIVISLVALYIAFYKN
ncbi:hypothetical protein ACIQWQ_04030 [Peribacillus frigoritolerans]